MPRHIPLGDMLMRHTLEVITERKSLSHKLHWMSYAPNLHEVVIRQVNHCNFRLKLTPRCSRVKPHATFVSLFRSHFYLLRVMGYLRLKQALLKPSICHTFHTGIHEGVSPWGPQATSSYGDFRLCLLAVDTIITYFHPTMNLAGLRYLISDGCVRVASRQPKIILLNWVGNCHATIREAAGK